MSRAKQLALLILLGVGVLTLSIIVLVRNRNIDVDFLAAIGILGGLAIVVVSLPIDRNGNGGQSGK